MKMKTIASYLIFCGTLVSTYVADGQTPQPKMSKGELANLYRQQREQQQAMVLKELQSGDPQQIAEAKASIFQDVIKHPQTPEVRMKPLFDAGLYDDALKMADDLLLRKDTGAYANAIEKTRVDALMSEKKWDQALSAAKTYYNCASLKETDDAISTVALCLINMGPDGEGKADRFKEQQAAWASPDATQPSEELGDSVLATIPTEPGPDKAAIDKIVPVSFTDLQWKGNLLLAAGRADEARKTFEKALSIAHDKQLTAGLENVARSIRAQNGCVGPANAYIIKMQKGQ